MLNKLGSVKSLFQSGQRRSIHNFPKSGELKQDLYKSGMKPQSGILPIWYERDLDFQSVRPMDLFSRLLKERIVFIDGPISNETASVTIAQLLLLDSESSTEEIKMYINSPGGSVHDGMAIYDTMQFVRAPVSTLCLGYACSMASLLLAAGTPGKRRILPHSYVMVHQPMSGTQGQASDIEIHAKHVLRLKEMLYRLYNQHTGQSIEDVEKILDRDTWYTAEEAIKWGLVDEIVIKKEVTKKPVEEKKE